VRHHEESSVVVGDGEKCGDGRRRIAGRAFMASAECRASPRAEAAWPSGSARRLGNPRRDEDDDLHPSRRHKKADRRLHSLTCGAGSQDRVAVCCRRPR
jgi:hypothetical protein